MTYTYKQLRSPFDSSIIRDDMILRVEDETFIPCSTDNKDYRAYLAWVDDGNTPLEPDPAPVMDPE
jgi:hypothetical protein